MIFIIPLALQAIGLTETVQPNYKEAIQDIQQGRQDEDKLLKLTELFYLDQNQAKAFETFLLALNQSPVQLTGSILSLEEKVIYDKAFELYLDPQAITAAQSILETNLPILDQHPDYNHLKFMIALAYANLGLFQKFFPIFYDAYIHDPSHYLVEKTKALLNIKLYEMTSTPKEKEIYRQNIEKHLNLAIKVFPEDTNLYKLAISFSSPLEKESLVKNSMELLIKQNITVPRHEIIFYVRNALDVKLNSLAQQFIDKAKIWYPYSRAINTAQTYLDQHGHKG